MNDCREFIVQGLTLRASFGDAFTQAAFFSNTKPESRHLSVQELHVVREDGSSRCLFAYNLAARKIALPQRAIQTVTGLVLEVRHEGGNGNSHDEYVELDLNEDRLKSLLKEFGLDSLCPPARKPNGTDYRKIWLAELAA